MQYNTLGRTDLKVSNLCLGSMTWGSQTSEAEGHAQIDAALDHGINFLDTAEMYPVNPVAAETVGNTEAIIGNWIAKSNRREEVVLATKISGLNGRFVRQDQPISSKTIAIALDQSLARLKTDYIDLYQLHWPNRGSYCFRQNWDYDPSGQDRATTIAHMDDVLEELSKHAKAGKIRHFGLSNESAWGTTNWLARAEATGGPRVQSIQNEYSLLNRMYDTDMAEVSANEDVGLLAYTPLGAGLLTGKYRRGAVPEGSRMALTGDIGGRVTERSHQAVEAYFAVADKHGLDPVAMALAFCRSRPFMTSVIFGATTMEQLTHILNGSELQLSAEVLADLNTAHKANPMPY